MHPKISRPAESQRPPNLLVYSRPKLGKTALLCGFGQGRILILDTQHGTDWMTSKKLNPHVWHIEKFDDWQEPYNYLRDESHPYEWVALDTTTKFHNMSLRKVVNAEGDKPLPSGISLPRRGLAGEHVKIVVDKFRQLGLGVIFTANERAVTKTEAEDENTLLDGEELANTNGEVIEHVSSVKYVPDLPADLRKYMTSEVDVIARLMIMYRKRTLWIGPHDNYDTGYRSGYKLSDSIIPASLVRLTNMLKGQKEKTR